MASEVKQLAIITPVFNDWASFTRLVRELDNVAGLLPGYGLNILAVNDGSTEMSIDGLLENFRPQHIQTLEVSHLVCNMGHQRAIAIGLSTLAARNKYYAVIVMDSDGEDRPEDIPNLLEILEREPQSIVVAQRAKRSENFPFRAFYTVYKLIFKALTGTRISFGNFSIIPGSLLPRIVHMPEVWNNLAAAVTRSRLPVREHPTTRGTRYAGKSKMNLVSLIIHGLSAMSVYSDAAFVRILLFSLALIVITVFGISIAVAIRFFTDLAIPGWTTTVVGVLAVILLQALMLSSGAVFLLLSGRSNLTVVPAYVSRDYVSGTDTLFVK